jgi:hypothetical protein
MVNWTKKDGQKSLAAMSTLKRAIGIRNHPSLTDEMMDKDCHVYTEDQQSADLIAELLYRWANGSRGHIYDKHFRGCTVRDTIEVHPLKIGGYEVCINVPDAQSFARGLERLTQKHVSPDAKFTR